MKKTPGHAHRLLLAIASFVMYSGAAWADGQNPEPPAAGDSGFTVLNNATNVTHWGLGVGAGIQQAPYKGYGTKYTPIPLISLDNKWVHAFGTAVDLKIGKWRNVSLALRGQYAIADGYKASDAPVLSGMQDRNSGFWYGPALAWRTACCTLSGNFLEGGNKGQKASIDFSKSFAYGKFGFEPHAGVDWLSSKYVDYYYGVRSPEVSAGRTEYTGKATYDILVGTRVSYKFTHRQILTLDVGGAYLGSGITDSPLVGRRYVLQTRVGYLYAFN